MPILFLDLLDVDELTDCLEPFIIFIVNGIRTLEDENFENIADLEVPNVHETVCVKVMLRTLKVDVENFKGLSETVVGLILTFLEGVIKEIEEPMQISLVREGEKIATSPIFSEDGSPLERW